MEDYLNKKEFSPGDIVQIRKKWGYTDLGIIVKNLYRGSSYDFDKFEVLTNGYLEVYKREELDLVRNKKDG